MSKSDQSDVSIETEIEADRIEAAVDCEILPRDWPNKDFEVIVVQWDHDIVGDVNSFSKARIINEVFQSNASVELYDTADGEEYVVFKVAE